MLLTALLVTEPSAATAQSFDCRMAATAVEKMICADRELATLDEEMARAFAAARKRAAAGRIGQAGWLKDVRNHCADAVCLKNAYRQRIAHLGDLEDLAGEWKRFGGSAHQRASLTVADVTSSAFGFELFGLYGPAPHIGLIEGTAVRTAAGAVYTDEESKCVVRFARKADRLVITLSDDCAGMGGMGVTFDGEFGKGDVPVRTFPMTDALPPGEIAWAGEWTRLGDHQFTGAYLTIAAVTATAFAFELTARSGANHGLVEGTAGRTSDGAVYTDEESNCVVRFARKADRLAITLSDDCVGMGGMGVTFDGEFAQGDIEPIALTLADLDLLAPGVSEAQFAAVVGGAYTAFTSSFQLMFDDEDLDGFGAKVVTGGVRGFFTEMEAIVMSHSDGRIFAAVLDDGEVKYFSNDPKFTTKLPATIEHWRQRFADKLVIFGSGK